MSQDIDAFLHDTLVAAHGGLDPDLMQKSLRDFQQALVRQMAHMKKARYKRRVVEAKCRGCQERNKFTLPQADPESVGRAMVAMTKAIDTASRLAEFLAGKPDSRPAAVGTDWLRGLTNEQLQTVQGWVEANGNNG